MSMIDYGGYARSNKSNGNFFCESTQQLPWLQCPPVKPGYLYSKKMAASQCTVYMVMPTDNLIRVNWCTYNFTCSVGTLA